MVEQWESTACDGEFAAVVFPEGVEGWNAGSGGVGEEGVTEVFEEL